MSKRYPGGILRKTPQTPTQTSAQGIWDMASVTQAVKENTWPIAGVPDPISKSLRFRSSASAYLDRTPASAGSRTTWTWSAWVKRGALGGSSGLFCAGTAGTDDTFIGFNSNDTFGWFNRNSSSVNSQLTTTQVFRDPAAWYNIVVVWNTTNGTSSNRMMIYVNGVQITSFTTTTYPSSSQTSNTNNNVATYIGQQLTSGNFFDGYLAEVNFIDGQALTPSSFGSTNDQTGVWQPIAYTGTYGTNGFYLPFSNTASTTTLGYDFSGNSNNWTTNNISLTSGSTYDSMVDVPTQWIPYNTAGDTGALFRGNYCVLNAASIGADATLSDANLTIAYGTSVTRNATMGTFGMSSGKWYWEVTITASSASPTTAVMGITNEPSASAVTAYPGFAANGWGYSGSDASKYNNGSGTAYGTTFAANDVIGFAFDADAGSITAYKNGVSQGVMFSSLAANTYYPSIGDGSGTSTFSAAANFGQRPFSYTPPTGFKTLCTTNLTTPTIGATASTIANEYFDATLYTGNGADNRTISSNLTPNFVWIKDRTNAYSHILIDSVRGTGKYLRTNGTNEENWDGNLFPNSGPTTNGFIVDGVSNASINANGDSYVGWQWKANGSGSTNTAGTITSTVSANTTAGFSIVTYTGNATNGATVGHGLGVSPSMIIGKIRSTTGGWYVWQTAMGDNFMQLNTTAAQLASTANGVYNTASFSSTVFALGSGSTMNASGGTYVAYCFAPIAGYSAFGSYTGNGSSDGTFIFTGFRPRFVMIKRTDTAGTDWILLDSSRDPTNVVDQYLAANLSDAEAVYANDKVDFLSNGFKQRGTASGQNGSGGTYIYMAFCESPFKFSLAR